MRTTSEGDRHGCQDLKCQSESDTELAGMSENQPKACLHPSNVRWP